MAKQTIFSQAVKKQTMAEQMAETIQELILSGALESGETLPTEPELAEQFGVSRAVVRDATDDVLGRSGHLIGRDHPVLGCRYDRLYLPR